MALLATAAMMSLSSAAVMADNESAITQNESVTGPTVTFDKYLVMKSNANVPNETFSFTISPGTAVAAVGTSPEIYAGKLPGGGDTITITGGAFSPGDTTYDSVQTDDVLTLESNYKYAKQTFTVDLSKVTYTDPGIYRYVITETAMTDADQGVAILNDENTRVLDVYVESDDNGKLGVLGTIFHKAADDVVTAQTDEESKTTTYVYENKPDGFTNTYTTYDLTLEKQVTGNQGNRNEYFEFTVTLSNAKAGTVYTVDLPDVANKVATEDDSTANPETLTVGADGTVTAKFYLKDNQSIVIQGLTSVTEYSIAETEKTDEGYTISYTQDTDTSDTADLTSVSGNTVSSTAMDGSDDKVVFTNYRSGIVPTGILMETAPYGAVVMLAAGMLLITVKRRKA
jgi:uncharacterized protein (UPF0333 family)